MDFVAKASAKFNDGDYISSFITVSCVFVFSPYSPAETNIRRYGLDCFFFNPINFFLPPFHTFFTLPNIPNIFFFIIFFFGKSSGQIDNFAQQKKNMPLPYYKCLVKFCHKSLIKTPPQHFLFLFLFPRGGNNNPLLENKIKI